MVGPEREFEEIRTKLLDSISVFDLVLCLRSTMQNTVEQPASMYSLLPAVAFQKEKKAFLSLSNRNELLLKVAM